MSSILTSVHEDDLPEIYPANQSRCGVCHLVSSKYTCPRCNLSYCSLACFKHQKHSSCSESFYKDSLEDELKNSRVNDDERIRMMEMLRNFEIEDDVEETPSLKERLGGADLNKISQEELWSKLTKEEQEEFSNAVRSGTSTHLLVPWNPWWTYHSFYLDTFVDGEPRPEIPDIHNLKSKMPRDQVNVPKLDELLLGKAASPLVSKNLVDVLYTYAFYCRLYNGCHKELSDEVSLQVIKSSAFLEKSQSCSSYREALDIAIERCSNAQGSTVDQKTLVGAMFDVFHLLQGRNLNINCMYVVPALSELHSIFVEFRRKYKKSKQLYDISHSLIFQAIKKLEFLLSWSLENRKDLCFIALQVLSVFKMRRDKLRSQRRMEKEADKMRREMLAKRQTENKKLIEELGK